MVRYDPAVYDGAAVHYRCGRPAYSPGLEALLAGELGLDGSGRLLDVGCGPGILIVRLAGLFEEAVGLDPDPEMIAEGRRAAEERGIANITWVRALAEDLPGAVPGTYRVVAFGSSFWWTDEVRVAEAVYDMLEPGGALVLVMHKAGAGAVPPSPGPPPIPHAEIEALAEKYLGSARRAGQGAAPPVRARSDGEDAIACTRFGVPRVIFAPASLTWCGMPKAYCPAISPFPGQRRTCSATVSRHSPPRCGGCCGRGLPRVFSGTGPAIPKWSLPGNDRKRQPGFAAASPRRRVDSTVPRSASAGWPGGISALGRPVRCRTRTPARRSIVRCQ
jgi:SAM-dependent methyltransferase